MGFRRFKYLVYFLFISSQINLIAQHSIINNSNFFYEISPVFGFKKGIVSLTFDDGSINQLSLALPLLRKLRLPATFYLITGKMDSLQKSTISKNITKHYEMGSHTVSHPDLCKIDIDSVKEELSNSQMCLKESYGINSGETFAYPWGSFNSSVQQIVKSLYLAARSTDIGYNSLKTPDRYALRMQAFGKNVDAYMANAWIDHVYENRLWLIEMYHGINSIGFSPVRLEKMQEHWSYIKDVEDKIWCSTVSNAIKYIDESRNGILECDLCNDTIFEFRVNDFLNDSVYNQPLSVKVKVPNNWDSISISNDWMIRTEYFNNSKFLLFNALPDNKTLTIKPGLIYEPHSDTGIKLVYLSENPFNERIKIAFETMEKADVRIRLLDLCGKIFIGDVQRNSLGETNVLLETLKIPGGIYILEVSDQNGHSIIKKMIKP